MVFLTRSRWINWHYWVSGRGWSWTAKGDIFDAGHWITESLILSLSGQPTRATKTEDGSLSPPAQEPLVPIEVPQVQEESGLLWAGLSVSQLSFSSEIYNSTSRGWKGNLIESLPMWGKWGWGVAGPQTSGSSAPLTSLAAGKGTVPISWLLDWLVTISHVPTEGEGERGQSYCPDSRGK